MKAEIEKILEELELNLFQKDTPMIEERHNATNQITALIIKWLESKKGQQCLVSGKYEEAKVYGRNQLITELIGEMK